MKKHSSKPTEASVIDSDILEEIALSLVAQPPSVETLSRIKKNLMDRVRDGKGKQHFVFSEQGQWKTIAQGVEIKILQRNTAAKTFLLRLSENAVIPYHTHEQNEESYVVEGNVWLDGVLCHAGDYHFAAAGTCHHDIHTVKGCTLLVRTA